jgi:hypothetical protein
MSSPHFGNAKNAQKKVSKSAKKQKMSFDALKFVFNALVIKN